MNQDPAAVKNNRAQPAGILSVVKGDVQSADTNRINSRSGIPGRLMSSVCMAYVSDGSLLTQACPTYSVPFLFRLSAGAPPFGFWQTSTLAFTLPSCGLTIRSIPSCSRSGIKKVA